MCCPPVRTLWDPVGPTYSVDNYDEVSTTNGFIDQVF
ncbi:hypothetical protein FHU31_005215 [Mycolicibacterium fluoranthenivorans]|uniref:Uncharacterized protein n=1 Tax=Mycolicibacterium fluoranthenivorans TaxID=258505 RepID=A0A7X5U4H7_9MYCO|nr:hypothetical protein [Mycolicibacterium fluoranthenivorans]